MNTNNIINNIMLDNIKDFYEYKSNWFNSDKQLNLYSIFNYKTNITSQNKTYLIYLGIKYNNYCSINSHVFCKFYFTNNIIHIDKELIFVFTSHLNIFLSTYCFNKLNNNNNLIFNNFIKGIQNEY